MTVRIRCFRGHVTAISARRGRANRSRMAFRRRGKGNEPGFQGPPRTCWPGGGGAWLAPFAARVTRMRQTTETEPHATWQQAAAGRGRPLLGAEPRFGTRRPAVFRLNAEEGIPEGPAARRRHAGPGETRTAAHRGGTCSRKGERPTPGSAAPEPHVHGSSHRRWTNQVPASAFGFRTSAVALLRSRTMRLTLRA